MTTSSPTMTAPSPEMAASSSTMAASVSNEASYFANRTSLSLKEIGLLRHQKAKKTRVAAQAATIRGAATSWIDQDDSGTYDPELDRKTPPQRKTHWAKKLPNSNGEVENGIEKKWQKPKGYGLIITFKFKTKPGLDYLRSLPAGPESSLRYLSEAEAEDVDAKSESESDDDRPRNKKRKKSSQKPKRPDQCVTNTRQDGLTLISIPADNPIIQGCKSCFNSACDNCSLIVDIQSYPCEACHDAGYECELIVPPQLKKACQECKRNKVFCSYRYDGGLGQSSCNACIDEGVPCAAAPLDPNSNYAKRFLPSEKNKGNGKAKATIKDEPEEEEDEEIKRGERIFTKCNQCRSTSQKCSLKSKADQGPCTSCQKINDTCRFVIPYSAKSRVLELRPIKSPSKKAREAFEKATRKLMIQEQRKIRKQISDGNGLVKIKTSFCNPIIFNYIPAPGEEETQPCHFCIEPFFGLTGNDDDNGPREIEGYWLPYGRGFHEVSKDEYGEIAGAVQNYEEEQTRMCITCTTTRIIIFSCPSHRLLPIEIQIPDSDAYDRAAQSLAEDKVSPDNLILNAKFCSVCPAIAFFTCGTGCGLHLCRSCAGIICKMQERGMEKGNETLDCLIREVLGGGWKYPVGSRADASFLASFGELITRLRAGMGQPIPPQEGEGNFIEGGKITGEEEDDLAVVMTTNKEKVLAGMRRRQEEREAEESALQQTQEEQQEVAKKERLRLKRKSSRKPLQGRRCNVKDFKPQREYSTLQMMEREMYWSRPPDPEPIKGKEPAKKHARIPQLAPISLEDRESAKGASTSKQQISTHQQSTHQLSRIHRLRPPR